MAFQRATINNLLQVRDAGGTTVSIRFDLVISDDGTSERASVSYVLTPSEFAALPGSGAARRNAIIAIIKREAHKAHTAFIARPQTPTTRDPQTDLGVTEITDFVGESP